MPAKSKSKNKSIWRSDKAQHFQLVHRSQRDPLINDPDAGAHVLMSYDPANQARAKGKTRAQLEADSSITRDRYGKPIRNNVGEAAQYGIYFDDTEYDYMQHLRPIQDDENLKRGGENVDEEVDTILLTANSKAKAKPKDSFTLKDGGQDVSAASSSKLSLPASALPSKQEMPFSYTSHMNVEPSLQGFQPDMDPHLRQALEALDDEAFVDDELDDDFFGEVVKDGEWDGIVRQEDTWREEAPEGDEAIWADPIAKAQREKDELGEENLSLEARVALFKKQQEMERAMSKGKGKLSGRGGIGSDDQGEAEEERDQLKSLPAGSRAGTMYTAGGSILGKKGKPGALARRAASTKAPSIGGGSTAWSMSSSAMFRNKGLSDLDDRFARLGKDYGIRDEDEVFDEELDALSDEFVDSDGEEAGDVVTREDFEGIMDEFLEKYDVKHGKMQEALGGTGATPAEKLTLVREALGKARIDGKDWAGKGVDEGKGEGELGEYEEYESPDEEIVDPIPRSHLREKWDVETIQSTKTNLENHPRTISAKESVFGGSNASVYRPGGVAGGKLGRSNGLGNGMAASMASYSSQRPSAAAFLDDEERLPKIRINPRTGFPEIVGYSKPRSRNPSQKEKNGLNGGSADGNESEEEGERNGDLDGRGPPSGSDSGSDTEGEEDYDSDATEGGTLRTATISKRNRNETPEERKARKEAIKANKKERKQKKSQTKQAFQLERKRQSKAEKGRKLTEGGPSGMRLL